MAGTVMIRQRVATWWSGLGQRERILVLVAVGVLLLGLLYVSAVEPAWKTRTRLVHELPRLQSELIQLKGLRAEAEQLAGRVGAVTSVDALRAAAEQSVLRANLVAGVTSTEDGIVSVSATNVPAQAWLSWLEAFARESRAAVVTARVARNDGPGRVDAEVSFRAQAR
jgi:general secretion pathway protein M